MADIHQGGGAVLPPECHPFARLEKARVFLESLGKSDRIDTLTQPSSAGIDDNGLEASRTHDSTQTASTCVTAGSPIRVGDGDGGGCHVHFPTGTDRYDHDSITEMPRQNLHGFVVPPMTQFRHIRDLGRSLSEENHLPGCDAGGTADHQRPDAHLGQYDSCHAPHIGLFDSPRERAFAGHGHATRCRQACTCKKTR